MIRITIDVEDKNINESMKLGELLDKLAGEKLK